MPKIDVTTPISGAAYPRAFRVLATVVLLVIAVQATRVGGEIAAAASGRDGWIVLGAGLLVLIGSYVMLLRSTTTIDATGLAQTGLLDKRVSWSELRSARLGGFGFAPRLLVRTEAGKFKVFFGGTAELKAAFGRIAQAYPPT